MDEKMIAKSFYNFQKYGITEKEVKAAASTLKRETGQVPTIFGIAEFLEGFIEWRKLQHRLNAGEIEIVINETEHGTCSRLCGEAINEVFEKYKEKGGENFG